MGKGTNGGHTILKVEYLSVAIICGIHLLQTRIGIQHGLSCFHMVILYQFASNANPFTTLECTQFCFRVCMELLGNILLLAGLNVQLAVKNMCCTKGTHSRLITFDRCQVICFSFSRISAADTPSAISFCSTLSSSAFFSSSACAASNATFCSSSFPSSVSSFFSSAFFAFRSALRAVRFSSKVAMSSTRASLVDAFSAMRDVKSVVGWRA